MKKKNYDEFGYHLCISNSCSKNHLVHEKTKKTVCGLKWKKDVWIPNAVYFNAPGGNCKICFKEYK